MRRGLIIQAGLLALTAGAGVANATVYSVSTRTTADNYYALYSRDAGDQLTFESRNEIGRQGGPGQFNWSLPEDDTFNTNDFFYIAAWSDDAFAQGLLGEFVFRTLNGGNAATVLTGDAGIRVFRTGLDRDDNAVEPTADEIEAQVAIANAGSLWRTPSVYLPNLPTTAPWGQIPGITPNAQWIWANSINGENVFQPGTNAGEYLIFYVPVPGPGVLALAGVGMLAAVRRSRK
jgi:MYXO-CTERM domain-containing protein